MSGVQIKKQKLTENTIPSYWPVDAFKTQYQTCLLLLAHGIPGLPYDLVYLIVKEYVYVKPLRVAARCHHMWSIHTHTGDSIDWCEHEMLDLHTGLGPRQLYWRWTHSQIVAWFKKHHFQVPEHFLPKDVKGCLPQY
jgi:hypothetical protein